MAKPESPRDIDLQDFLFSIQEVAQEYINFLYSDEYHEDGIDNYEYQVFSKVITGLYGDDVYDRMRKDGLDI